MERTSGVERPSGWKAATAGMRAIRSAAAFAMVLSCRRQVAWDVRAIPWGRVVVWFSYSPIVLTQRELLTVRRSATCTSELMHASIFRAGRWDQHLLRGPCGQAGVQT